MSDLFLTSDAPWHRAWPADEQERVAACPICGGAERTVWHEHLVDNVFFAAPGTWTLHGCCQCGGAYLDPRPSPASIHRAYSNYYTHQQTAGKDDYAALSPLRKLRRRLVNGYTNWRYGTQAFPSCPLGVLLIYVIPRLKRMLDREYRHMPKCTHAGGQLLDMGCGDGSFLSLARKSGWTVVGLDPDPMAVANATRQGLTVYEGGIEYFDGQSELFDVITMNHVIEHIHEPFEVLKRCRTLLKPGGQLWVETPNIDSLGHSHFQKNWRGLETPRHLVLFNYSSLKQIFNNAGFAKIHYLDCPSPSVGMFKASYSIVKGDGLSELPVLPKLMRLRLAIMIVGEVVFPKRREFITIMAKK